MPLITKRGLALALMATCLAARAGCGQEEAGPRHAARGAGRTAQR